jgi:WD40 repeat protein
LPDPLVLPAHGRHAQAVAFTRSGRILLSAGQDARIRLWSVPGFKSVGEIIGHKNSVNSISFSPDEKLFATSSSDGTVRVWSFPDGRQDQLFERQVAARFSSSGRYLATLSTKGRATVWSMPEGAQVMATDALDRRTLSLEFTPDEQTLLVGGAGTIHRVSVADGSVMGTMKAHEVVVAALRVSPDGATLVSTSGTGVVRFWSVSDWSLLGEVRLEHPGMMALAFSPDSTEVSTGVDFHIATISVRDREVTTLRRVASKGVYGLAYSPDGKYLANAAADGRVRVWTLKEAAS